MSNVPRLFQQLSASNQNLGFGVSLSYVLGHYIFIYLLILEKYLILWSWFKKQTKIKWGKKKRKNRLKRDYKGPRNATSFWEKRISPIALIWLDGESLGGGKHWFGISRKRKTFHQNFYSQKQGGCSPFWKRPPRAQKAIKEVHKRGRKGKS